MTISAKTAVVVTVALVAAVTLAGCGLAARRGIGAQTPAGSIAVTTTASAVASATPAPAASGASGVAVSAAGAKPGLTESDVKSLGQELDAMQKELDGLNMPSESDYSGAAGAVY